MPTRLKALERIALVYIAIKHARGLSLEQAAAALRETDASIEGQRARARRSSVEGKAALGVGESLEWQMHESEKQFTEWNAQDLIALRQRRATLLREAIEEYRAGRLQLEQMESLLRELRARRDLERAHRTQRESDDRFLSRQWWAGRAGGDGIDATDILADIHANGDASGDAIVDAEGGGIPEDA